MSPNAEIRETETSRNFDPSGNLSLCCSQYRKESERNRGCCTSPCQRAVEDFQFITITSLIIDVSFSNSVNKKLHFHSAELQQRPHFSAPPHELLLSEIIGAQRHHLLPGVGQKTGDISCSPAAGLRFTVTSCLSQSANFFNWTSRAITGMD